jgi:hypothetical protein
MDRPRLAEAAVVLDFAPDLTEKIFVGNKICSPEFRAIPLKSPVPAPKAPIRRPLMA